MSFSTKLDEILRFKYIDEDSINEKQDQREHKKSSVSMRTTDDNVRMRNGGVPTKENASSVGSADENSSSSQKEPIRAAFFSVTVILLAVFFVLGVFAAYFLFYDFVKPMIWALITGIILFPLKRKLVRWVRGWLNYLYFNKTPLTVGVFTLPYEIVMELGDFILDLASKNLKAVFLIGASFPACSLVLYYETIPKLLIFLKRMAQNVDAFISLFRGPWVPAVFVAYVVYIVVLNFFFPKKDEQTSVALSVLKSTPFSFAVWTATLAYVCGYFGPFATPVFAVVLVLCSTYYFAPSIGSLEDETGVTKRAANPERSRRQISYRKSFLGGKNVDNEADAKPVSAKVRRLSQPDVSPVPQTNDLLTNGRPKKEKEENLPTSAPESSPPPESESNLYLKYLFFGCFFVWISLHLWMIFLLLLPVGLALIKRLVLAFNIPSFLKTRFGSLSAKFENDLDLLLPSPLRHLVKVILHLDRQIIFWLKESMDVVGSFTAMFLLLVVAAGMSGFVFFQLYYESLRLIQLITNIANQTLTNNVAFQNWLQSSANVTSVAELTDKAVEKAYGMGRNWLSAQVHEIISNDEEKARLLESQIVTTFDTFFNNWVTKKNDTMLSEVGRSQKSAIANWNEVWSAIEDEEWKFFDYVQEYFTVAWSIADSAWLVIKNNMEVLLVGLSQMMSTIIASGTAVVDFFLDSIVFFTFLMFLLSSSDDEYKPMKLIRDLVPSGREVAVKLTEEMEEAVSSVFLATFKMAVFYGMFTWLTHTLFAVNIVFIPSVLAAMFAAVPFFGTYIVAAPAILELWLVRGEPFLAILLFILHYVPSYIVDDAIYSEIRLTTPFVTGMAITGGMLWWGLEGAIFGPLVLCCLLVTGSMYTDMFSQRAPTASTGSYTLLH